MGEIVSLDEYRMKVQFEGSDTDLRYDEKVLNILKKYRAFFGRFLRKEIGTATIKKGPDGSPVLLLERINNQKTAIIDGNVIKSGPNGVRNAVLEFLAN